MKNAFMKVIITLLAIVSLSLYATDSAAATSHQRATQLAAVKTAVNINKADVQQIASLKGIGPKKAKAIVAYRKEHGTFRSFDDLANVRGFSKNSVEKLLKQNPGMLTIKSRS